MPAQYEVPAWGQSPYQDLTVPSGGLILAKRLDMQDIIEAGLIDEFDSLSPVVEEKVVGPAKGKRPTDRQTKKPTKAEKTAADKAAMQKMFRDKDSMKNLARIMGLVIPIIVQKPEVVSTYVKDGNEWHTIAPEDREEGVIYVDSIPLADQMFILQWAMEGINMDDLKSVGEQSKQALGDMAPEPESADETE